MQGHIINFNEENKTSVVGNLDPFSLAKLIKASPYNEKKHDVIVF